MGGYRQLDERQIQQTLEELRERIVERFPDANLRNVCEELMAATREATEAVAYIRRPNWPLRLAGAVATVGLAVLLMLIVKVALDAPGEMGTSDIVQSIEAAVNDVVFFGVAVFFLLTIETRAKRKRALTVLHELRSLAHIVDMHQLTKDPERLSSPLKSEGEAGGGATKRKATGATLGRYLDFCSELLSLISKVSALLVQHFNDSEVLSAVNEVEALTTGLSGKIWQKINILERSRR